MSDRRPERKLVVGEELARWMFATVKPGLADPVRCLTLAHIACLNLLTINTLYLASVFKRCGAYDPDWEMYLRLLPGLIPRPVFDLGEQIYNSYVLQAAELVTIGPETDGSSPDQDDAMLAVSIGFTETLARYGQFALGADRRVSAGLYGLCKARVVDFEDSSWHAAVLRWGVSLRHQWQTGRLEYPDLVSPKAQTLIVNLQIEYRNCRLALRKALTTKPAEQSRQWLGFGPLRLDVQAKVAHLGIAAYQIEHPALFAFLIALVQARGGLVPTEAREKLPGCKGRVGKLIETHLPPDLARVIKAKRGNGGGHYLDLPKVLNGTRSAGIEDTMGR